MQTRFTDLIGRGTIVVITLAVAAFNSAPGAYAGDRACGYASFQTPGPPDGAFVSIQWGGVWADSCTPFNPQFTIADDRIDVVFQAGASTPGFGCSAAETPFCVTATSPMVAAPGTYDLHITVNDALSGALMFTELMETVIVAPGCAAAWTPAFGDRAGFDGPIDVITELATGPGLETHLFAAGRFTTAGTAGTSHIAHWTGDAWGPVGGGLAGAVTALVAFDDGYTFLGQSAPWLFAAGDFPGRVRRWTPLGWSSLGSGLDDGEVLALTVFDDGLGDGPALYAGGTFTSAGGVPTKGLAKWDGASWTEVGGGVNGTVRALAILDDGSGPALYVAGFFGSAGSIPVQSLGKWNGTDWTNLGGELQCSFVWISGLFTIEDEAGPSLYIAGSFVGGPNWGRLVRWDGINFAAGGLWHSVTALALFDDGTGPALHAGGSTDFIGAWNLGVINRLDGASWSQVALWQGTVNSFHAIAHNADGPQLFVATDVSDLSHRVIRYDGLSWTPTHQGVDGVVTGVEAFDDGQGAGPAIYIAGEISTTPDLIDNTVSKWDGDDWVPVAGGLSGVRALKAFDDGTGAGVSLFAGTHRLDGDEWLSTPGLFGTVVTLESYDDGSGTPVLYAGGSIICFDRGIQTAGIAQWTGSTWTHCGEGVYHNPLPGEDLPVYVRALAAFDDGQGEGTQLYVGGGFTLDDDSSTGYGLARWNGTSWSSVGEPPLHGLVTALAAFDDGLGAGAALYAAFSQLYEADFTIVRWDGVEWSEVAIANNTIDTLKVFDDGTGPQLYAGGKFTAIDETPVNGVARWDGTAWSALESDLTAGFVDVRAMTQFDDGTGPHLIIGGGFRASPTDDAYVARWRGCVSDSASIGDLNGDGIVDGADLGLLLNNWGSSGTGDLNEDGIVDGADLGLLLNNWG